MRYAYWLAAGSAAIVIAFWAVGTSKLQPGQEPAAVPADGPPAIVVLPASEQTVVGTISEGIVSGTVAIELRNHGSSRLELARISTGCGCAKAELSPDVLSPGQSATASIAIRGTNAFPHSSGVAFHFVDGVYPVEVRCTVVPPMPLFVMENPGLKYLGKIMPLDGKFQFHLSALEYGKAEAWAKACRTRQSDYQVRLERGGAETLGTLYRRQSYRIEVAGWKAATADRKLAIELLGDDGKVLAESHATWDVSADWELVPPQFLLTAIPGGRIVRPFQVVRPKAGDLADVVWRSEVPWCRVEMVANDAVTEQAVDFQLVVDVPAQLPASAQLSFGQPGMPSVAVLPVRVYPKPSNVPAERTP